MSYCNQPRPCPYVRVWLTCSDASGISVHLKGSIPSILVQRLAASLGMRDLLENRSTFALLISCPLPKLCKRTYYPGKHKLDYLQKHTQLLWEISGASHGHGPEPQPMWYTCSLLNQCPITHCQASGQKADAGFVEMEFYHVGQAGLKFLTSGDLLDSGSQSAGITCRQGFTTLARLVSNSWPYAICPPTFASQSAGIIGLSHLPKRGSDVVQCAWQKSYHLNLFNSTSRDTNQVVPGEPASGWDIYDPPLETWLCDGICLISRPDHVQPRQP
ncbi:hypothetical protein AAY473_017738 [Plecturocebus cupreus]